MYKIGLSKFLPPFRAEAELIGIENNEIEIYYTIIRSYPLKYRQNDRARYQDE